MRILKGAIALLVSIMGFIVFGAIGLAVLAVTAMAWPVFIGLVVGAFIVSGIIEYIEKKKSSDT